MPSFLNQSKFYFESDFTTRILCILRTGVSTSRVQHPASISFPQRCSFSLVLSHTLFAFVACCFAVSTCAPLAALVLPFTLQCSTHKCEQQSVFALDYLLHLTIHTRLNAARVMFASPTAFQTHNTGPHVHVQQSAFMHVS